MVLVVYQTLKISMALQSFRMLLEMVAENWSDDQEDFFISEHQAHIIDISMLVCCHGTLATKNEVTQLPKVWKNKTSAEILNQHWEKKFPPYDKSKGYRASEIAKNLGISLNEFKKWIQRLELKECITIETKKLVFTIYLVRCIRAVFEWVYILRFWLRKENIKYSTKENIPEQPEKLIIIASGCAGKSTFSKKRIFYGYTIYDDMRKIWDRTTDFEDFRWPFLRNHAGKVCVLDPLFAPMKFFDDIDVVVVMPPKKIHFRNYKVRRSITGTFSMKLILNWRRKILQLASDNNLQIFSDFETALIQLSKEKIAK